MCIRDRIRAAYYQLYNDLKPGYDFVFVARSRTPFVKSQKVYDAMKDVYKRQSLNDTNSGYNAMNSSIKITFIPTKA